MRPGAPARGRPGSADRARVGGRRAYDELNRRAAAGRTLPRRAPAPAGGQVEGPVTLRLIPRPSPPSEAHHSSARSLDGWPRSYARWRARVQGPLPRRRAQLSVGADGPAAVRGNPVLRVQDARGIQRRGVPLPPLPAHDDPAVDVLRRCHFDGRSAAWCATSRCCAACPSPSGDPGIGGADGGVRPGDELDRAARVRARLWGASAADLARAAGAGRRSRSGSPRASRCFSPPSTSATATSTTSGSCCVSSCSTPRGSSSSWVACRATCAALPGKPNGLDLHPGPLRDDRSARPERAPGGRAGAVLAAGAVVVFTCLVGALAFARVARTAAENL